MAQLPTERVRHIAKLFAAPGTPAARAASRINVTPDAAHERTVQDIAQRMLRERRAKQSGVVLRRGR